MRAVICCLNSQYIHSSLAPWCLLAGVRTYADIDIVSATVVEGTINEPSETVLQRILEQKPTAVAFCCYIWNVQMVLVLAEQLKQRMPQLQIIVGGPEVSYRAEDVLQQSSIDYVLSGEGERPFAALLTALATNGSIADIPGLSYRLDNRVVVGEPFVTRELPPSPYVEEYFETLNGRIAYLETSRGCPFSCAFCLSGRCGGVRYYPLERAEREIIELANSGTKTVKFVDRTFNADRKRAFHIIRFIISHYGIQIPKNVCFHFEVAGDLLDEETVTVLSEAPAGLFQLEIGVQSFHEPTLRAVSRKTDIAKLTKSVRRLLACNTVHIHIDLIAGLPQETLSIFAKSFDKAFSLSPHMLQLGFLKVLHGTPMRECAEQYPCDFSSSPPYEVTGTPWISESHLIQLHRVECVLDRMYNSGRFRRTLEYLLQSTGRSPFALFNRLADYLPDERMSLDAYTERVYAACCMLDGVDAEILRDRMVCDRLATNASGIVPAFLHRDEKERKRLKRLADSDARFRRVDGIKRGTALVEGRLVYADYDKPHPVTGEYALRYFNEKCLSRSVRYLLFDLDGTLTDPAVGITRSIQYALRHFGIEEPDRDKLLSYIGPPLLDTFKGYGLDDEQSREALRVYREYFADIGLYENEVYEGIADFLKDAQAAGYRLLMATSKPEVYACRLMQFFGLSSYFACIAGSDMDETRADKAAVIRHALTREGICDLSQAVMIGDRKFDVDGAKKFGMASVGVLYGYGSRAELTTAQPDYIVETVADLRALFL